MYIRFESATPNDSGAHIGIFGLANGLAWAGQLTPAEWRWWRDSNDRLDVAYADPGATDPSLFDKSVNPRAACWFKDTATDLLDGVRGYLDLLDRHGVGWAERRSAAPGRVLYEDDVQIVVSDVDEAGSDVDEAGSAVDELG